MTPVMWASLLMGLLWLRNRNRARFDVSIGQAVLKSTPKVKGKLVVDYSKVTSAPDTAIVKHPLDVVFIVKMNGFEKLAVDSSDVASVVKSRASMLPGKGAPRVSVSDVPAGFSVFVRYPDSTGAVSPARAKSLIESVDPRLSGRVSGVKVSRA